VKLNMLAYRHLHSAPAKSNVQHRSQESRYPIKFRIIGDVSFLVAVAAKQICQPFLLG
jgi:hypothetical protein